MNITGTNGAGEGDPRSEAAVVLQSATMMIIIVAAIGGNLLILAAIYIDKTLQTLTNAFIVNLACADFLLAVVGMPFTLASSITYDWIFGNDWCVINGMANSLFCVASILTLAAVSVDRYIAILHPFRYSLWMTKKTVTAMLTYIWLHSFVIAILPAVGWSSYTFLRMESICTVRWHGSVAFTLFLFAVCFFVPLAVIMFTYYKIFRTANKQSKRIVPVTGKILSPAEQEYDDEMSSIASTTQRPACASVSETETRRSARRTPCALEVSGRGSTAELAETSPSSKDSGFDEPHSSSTPSLRALQTSNQPEDAQMQRNSSDSTVVVASVSPETSARPDIKTCGQGTTEEQAAQSKPELRINSGGALVRVPSWYVENRRVGALKPQGDCRELDRSDSGPLPAIAQQRLSPLLSEKKRTKHTSPERLSGHQTADKNDRQEREVHSSRTGPIPTIVPPSSAGQSRAPHAQQKKRRQKSGRKLNSSAFSLRETHLVSPTLFVLGHKSAALLRSRKRSSDYRSKLKRDRKAAKTIVIVLGTFILLWGPHFIGIFCLLLDDCSWPDEFYAATTWLAMLNSACNPIIYGVMSRQFRKRFFQILRCRRGFF